MGQQHNSLTRIHQISQSLTLVRQLPGERVYVNRATDQQYLLITRLAQGQDDIEPILQKRKGLRCSFVPQLVDFGRENQGYCSDIAVMNILFKHPAKCLSEEQMHRSSVGEWFEEGEVLMVSYCALQALQEFSKMGDGYELTVNEETLLIEMDGKIILTDTARFKEQSSRRSLRRICSQQGKIISRIATMQLGVVLHRIIHESPASQVYSDNLRHFVDTLKAGQFLSYEEALAHLEFIKEAGRPRKLPKNQVSQDETPSNMLLPQNHDTPIGELMHLIDQRQPLGEIGNCQKEEKGRGKKKQSRHHIYKSKFQERKAEAFAEECSEHALNQESTSIRLDQISSIQERQTFRETEEDEQQVQLDTANILPEQLACYESQQIGSTIAKIELFSSNRPQRLKQLVLNQKGIIYEESADELSSLASQRTHRLRNFSFYND